MIEKQTKLTEEDISRLINFCKAIQESKTDPFDFDVNHYLEILNEYLKKMKALDIQELLIDADALNEISKVIELQSNWVKMRTGSFWVDPLLVELRLNQLSSEDLVSALYGAWHPVCSLDVLTSERLRAGMNYWEKLRSLSERYTNLPEYSESEGRISIEDMIELRLLAREEFKEQVDRIKNELDRAGKQKYEEFVLEPTFDKTVEKAYLMSYLITGGGAIAEIDPITGEIFVSPSANGRKNKKQNLDTKSVPIEIDYQLWLEWKKRQEQKEN
jgi:spore coat protein CotH